MGLSMDIFHSFVRQYLAGEEGRGTLGHHVVSGIKGVATRNPDIANLGSGQSAPAFKMLNQGAENGKSNEGWKGL